MKLPYLYAFQKFGHHEFGFVACTCPISGGRPLDAMFTCGFENGEGSWEHFGSAMRHLDFHSHYKFWGFAGAVLGCAGGVLMILGLFFRVGVLLTLAITLVHLVVVWDSSGDFHTRLPALEMAILLLSLLFIGPGK